MALPIGYARNALIAAQAGQCAAEQQQYWPMHVHMQKNSQQFHMEGLIAYAGGIGLNLTSFRSVLTSEISLPFRKQ
jgi:hypothetical protein